MIISSTAVHPLALDPDKSTPALAVPLAVIIPVTAVSTVGPMIFQFSLSPVSQLRGTTSTTTLQLISLMAILLPLLICPL
jgi:hypothetical protein